MDEEVNALLSKQTLRRVKRELATMTKAEIVGTTWVFKRKRRPDGAIIKLKARLVVRGDQQRHVGCTVNETYAPVMEWSTIRLLLTLAVTHNLCTTQIDFKNAFVQSDLPAPIYVELPPGGYCSHPDNAGMILEVIKSLYGDRRAPKLWHMYLRSKLESIGFIVDPNDACQFTKPGCVFVNYVDDGIFIAEDQSTITEILQQLKTKEFDFDEMGSLLDYLGVHVGPSLTSPDSLELPQPDLTARIIEVMGLQNANAVSTPAECALGLCENDEPALGLFNYRSVVGMAMFLCNNTRLDCAMAVHQCARYSAQPKRTHEAALKHIGRYLLGTCSRGLIIQPTKHLKVDCYVDANFAGVFNTEDAADPRSVRSRTGFILTLGDVPILWKSQLQPQIALSTMEAEYIALSTALHSLLTT
jgi:Reverse transcriptase (RNA-dependent DNA polymerase)